jgi:hypothetical protein
MGTWYLWLGRDYLSKKVVKHLPLIRKIVLLFLVKTNLYNLDKTMYSIKENFIKGGG